jgi:hypothetical protein
MGGFSIGVRWSLNGRKLCVLPKVSFKRKATRYFGSCRVEYSCKAGLVILCNLAEKTFFK